MERKYYGVIRAKPATVYHYEAWRWVDGSGRGVERRMRMQERKSRSDNIPDSMWSRRCNVNVRTFHYIQTGGISSLLRFCL